MHIALVLVLVTYGGWGIQILSHALNHTEHEDFPSLQRRWILGLSEEKLGAAAIQPHELIASGNIAKSIASGVADMPKLAIRKETLRR